jgi:hypothetical protein
MAANGADLDPPNVAASRIILIENVAPQPERIDPASVAVDRGKPLRNGQQMLPLGVFGIYSPEMRPPFRRPTPIRFFSLFVRRRKVQVAVGRLDNLRVDFDLAFSGSVDTGLPQAADDISAVEDLSGDRIVFEQVGRAVASFGRNAESDVAPMISTRSPPNGICAGKSRDRDLLDAGRRIRILRNRRQRGSREILVRL